MAQASAALVLHKGARLVQEDELRRVPAPPPEGRWFPIRHFEVLDRVRTTLDEAGFAIAKQELALSRSDARFFGTLTLSTPLGTGVNLAIGVRSSTDRTFPLGFAAGSRIFVCDNLAFRSDLLSVKRKHSLRGAINFQNDIAAAVHKLGEFRLIEQERIKLMMHRELSEMEADSIILRAFERGIISAPYLPRIIREWREPQYDEFRDRTAFSLLNCFTTILGERAQRNPSEYAVQTMRLNSFIDKSTALVPV